MSTYAIHIVRLDLVLAALWLKPRAKVSFIVTIEPEFVHYKWLLVQKLDRFLASKASNGGMRNGNRTEAG